MLSLWYVQIGKYGIDGNGDLMTLNKTKIEWCDRTWNPITGCLHGCSYCYARKIAERFRGTKSWPNGFDPTFHPERLDDPILEYGTEQCIFVCSMADLFGEWLPSAWIKNVFEVMHRSYWHTYIILTKNPKRITRVVSGDMYADNIWLGVSVEDMDGLQRICELQKVPEFKKFVSFEPLLEKIPYINLDGIAGIIVGARTNPPNEITPDMVQPIGQAAFEAGNIPVFMKNSMPSWCCRRELAWKINKPLERIG
jgi:protein gp37